VVSNINIGELHKIKVRIEGSDLGHDWLLDHIIVSGGGLANPVRFDSKLWMSDDQPSVELFPIPNSPKRIGEAETLSAKAQNVVAAPAKALSAAPPTSVPTSVPSRVKDDTTKATIIDFINAQNGISPSQLKNIECPTYTTALGEIRKGKKYGHWIWYIIPSSIGISVTANFFNLPNANVTVAQYLSDEKLGPRYVEMLTAIGTKLQEFINLNPSGDVITFLVKLMGGNANDNTDYAKLKDSLTIFYNELLTQCKLNNEIQLLAQHFKPSVPSVPSVPTPSAAATSVLSAVPSAAQPVHPHQPNEEIQKMLNNADMHIRQKAQFALKKYNDNYVEAINALKPPSLTPAQVQTAYMKTPAYLKDPDIFVKTYVQNKSIPLLPNPLYQDDSNGRNLNAFPANFHAWHVIYTVGEGNCLTHAFLQCLSSTYGKITGQGYTNKSKVAQEFRLMFSSESDLARDKLEYEIGDGLADLSDLQILDYSRLFNVITVVFEQVVVNPSDGEANPILAYNFHSGSNPNDTVIFIHADGGHYSSVMLSPGKFTMTLNDAQQIENLQKPLSIQKAPIPDA
jgi:uncharacterized protein (DUF1810 family)